MPAFFMSRHRFNAQIAKVALVAIRAGASDENAAGHAGVDLAALRDWLRGDTAATEQFRRDVEKARADLELLAVGSMRRTIQEDKGAALYFAERLHGDRELARLRDLTT